MKNCIYNEFDEEVPLPTKKEVCPACRGEGTRALHGYDVTEQCREDPDFADDYFAGHCDTLCDECEGARVVDVVDEDRLTPEQLEEWHAVLDDEAAHWAEVAAERRAGC